MALAPFLGQGSATPWRPGASSGRSGGGSLHSCGKCRRRTLEVVAASREDWMEYEEGIFQGVERPRRPLQANYRGEEMKVTRSRLVPEKWRQLQRQLSRTKEELRLERIRYRDDCARAIRMQQRAVIERFHVEGQRDEQAEVTHTVFTENTGHRVSYRADELDDEPYVGNEESIEQNRAVDQEDEWPPVGEVDEEQGREQAPRADFKHGRATPINPRLALGNLTFEELSNKMNEPPPEPEAQKPNLNDYTTIEDVVLTQEEKEFLMKRDPDFDRITSDHWLPLHTLAVSDQPSLVRELIFKGCPVDALDKDGHSALYKATVAGRCSVVRVLLKGGANPLLRDNNGATLLHHAVSSAHPEIVRMLLKSGIDINSVDDDGWTPLHVAVQAQKKDITRWMVIYGADRSLANKNGDTPMDLALRFGSGFHSCAIVKVLKVVHPRLEKMRGIKGCEAAIPRVIREGQFNQKETVKDKELVKLARDAQKALTALKRTKEQEQSE